jgi:hypothetical protein
MGRQLGQVAGLPPALAQGLTSQPRDHPYHMHGGGIQQLLEVRARQAQVPTPTEINAPNALRQAALHPCPQGVLGVELRGPLALPRRLERLMVDLWADRELARPACRTPGRRSWVLVLLAPPRGVRIIGRALVPADAFTIRALERRPVFNRPLALEPAIPTLITVQEFSRFLGHRQHRTRLVKKSLAYAIKTS